MSGYYEIVLDGDVEVLKGFVAGYLAASGIDREVFVSREFHVQHDSLAHQFAEWVGLVEDRTHLIVPEEAWERIRSGAERLGDRLKISIHSSRRLTGARFEFRWLTYNTDEAKRLRALFETPPPGVQLDGYAPEEFVHEDEKGKTGMYAPTHPFKARASGQAHGEPGPVIQFAAVLREDEFVTVDTVKLEYAD